MLDPFNPFGTSHYETFDPYADYTAATDAADYGEPCEPGGSNSNCNSNCRCLG
jgi:hypothetical protein